MGNSSWTTKKVNKLIDTLNETGVMPRNNPFFMNNVDMRKPNVHYGYTKSELKIMCKIESSIIWFAENYAKVLTDNGVVIVKLRDYQKRIIIQLNKYRNNIWLASRQIGKCISPSTKIKIRNKNTKVESNIPIYKLNPNMDSHYLDLHERELWGDISQIDCELEKAILDIGESDEDDICAIDAWENKDIEIWTDTGWKSILMFYKTVPYEEWEIKTTGGKKLKCADNHRIYTQDIKGEIKCVYAKNLKRGDKVFTDKGIKYVTSARSTGVKISMYDIHVEDENHRFFADGILSHNSIVSAIYIAWYLITNTERNVMVLSQNGDKVKELMSKIKTILNNLPFFMKLGVKLDNVMTSKFDNGCGLYAQTTSKNSGASYTIHVCYMDEFALIPENFLNDFYRTVYPTLSSSSISRMIITSTPRGYNKFYQIYSDAIQGKNFFHPIRTDWFEVDGRDEKWKMRQIMDLGSEEDFMQEFGNSFDLSGSMLFSTIHAKKVKASRTNYVSRSIECLEYMNQVNEDNGLPIIDYGEILKFHPRFDPETMRNESCQMALSIDLSEADGNDYIAISFFKVLPLNKRSIDDLLVVKDVTDFFKLVQVGMLRVNVIDINVIANILYHIFVNGSYKQENIKSTLEINKYGEYLLNLLRTIHRDDNDLDVDSVFTRYYHTIGAKFKKLGLKVNKPQLDISRKLIKDKIRYNHMVVTDSTSCDEALSYGKSLTSGRWSSQTGSDDAFATLLNICHYYDTPHFREQVDILLEYVPDKFLRYIDNKMKMSGNINNPARMMVTDIEYNSLSNPYAKPEY